MRFSCADALADGTLTDPTQEAALVAIAAGLRWKGDDPFGPPADCHRAVRLICGPRLDRGGDVEAIVEVSWRFTAPVRPGDEITGEVEVTGVRDDKPITTLATRVVRGDGVVVIEGTAACYTMALT